MKPAITDIRLAACKTAVLQAGGNKAVAEKFGISRQAVGKWKKVPSERVLVVEKASGISRYILRPDIYGKAPREEVSA
jgi:DNA-binding transcriptional regulator YdaS (Cro superfamily)